MTTDRTSGGFDIGKFYGGQGNDKITAPTAIFRSNVKVYGNEGDDKLTIGDSGLNDTYNGGLGNDIIYGGSDKFSFLRYWGDYSSGELIRDPSLGALGGNDKIYGGNNILGT